MQHRPRLPGGIIVFGALVLACNKSQGGGNERASLPPAPTIHSAQLPEPSKRSSTIESVEVPNDKRVLVVLGEDTKRPLIYLHGMCSEARSDLDAWASSVNQHGTVIALTGDAECQGKGGTTWTTNVRSIDARIERAIDAVSKARQVELDASQRVVIGESMGAARATALAAEFPAKYTRLVLVGGPETPSAKDLGQTKYVALLAGTKEPQEKMRQGALGLEGAGLQARFWDLPDATHGTYGSDGPRRMSEALGFVTQ